MQNLLMILMTLFSSSAEEKPTLIYIGDPMCSWCYGISGEMQILLENQKEVLNFELVLGGLRPGGGEEWNKEFKDFLRHHWEDVGMRSGQPFKFDILDKDYFFYDTEPSCRAVTIVKSINPKKAFDFFKATQIGFYLKNEDPKTTAFYKSICEDLEIDFQKFSAKFESESMKHATAKEFERAQNLGVQSFPTVLLKHKGNYYPIAKGYSTANKMQARIEAVLQK